MIYREIGIGKALLRTYVLSNYKDLDLTRRRAFILICPGGGYHFCSEREAEAVAIRFNSLGYNAAVLYYTCNPLEEGHRPEGVFPEPQEELARAVAWVRCNAENLNTDPSKIVVLGFSAGGHLAASLGVFWPEYGEISRPNALVLCYSVITSGPLAHRGSIDNLIGNRTDLLETVSLEKQVTDKTPPSFIWASDKDPSVPCQNSIMFKEALESCGVRAELHLYDSKVHGISLASREVMKPGVSYNPDVSDWPERADRFLQSVLGPVF
ncbi:MAG: alpha/beta hydrolase [Spirochaetales bacterium]|nr:alpha/beta hydrolase [Spirochaetales bacterium]MBR6234504.1 alpha/beta hydrolase [Spirochaetales bacterium]